MDNIVSWKAETLKGQFSKYLGSLFSFICCNNGGFYQTAPHTHSHLGTDQYHQCLMCPPNTHTHRLLQVCFSVFGLWSVWIRTLQRGTGWASGCKQDYWMSGCSPDVAALFSSDLSSPRCLLLSWRTCPLSPVSFWVYSQSSFTWSTHFIWWHTHTHTYTHTEHHTAWLSGFLCIYHIGSSPLYTRAATNTFSINGLIIWSVKCQKIIKKVTIYPSPSWCIQISYQIYHKISNRRPRKPVACVLKKWLKILIND